MAMNDPEEPYLANVNGRALRSAQGVAYDLADNITHSVVAGMMQRLWPMSSAATFSSKCLLDAHSQIWRKKTFQTSLPIP